VGSFLFNFTKPFIWFWALYPVPAPTFFCHCEQSEAICRTFVHRNNKIFAWTRFATIDDSTFKSNQSQTNKNLILKKLPYKVSHNLANCQSEALEDK
ncbi:MAG: hypothetical protein J0I88_11065, partial [Chryseobacterium sp.]|nr:hypothetical protein [Chryseobacterium sp.]